MKIVALNANPQGQGLTGALLDRFCHGARANGAAITTFQLQDMQFDPVLHDGYGARQEWEPDLDAFMHALQAADHLVIAYPMWWGGQPAKLKGLFDRGFLQGVAFQYREDNPMWDKLMTGKSATILMTGDTPGFFLRVLYGGGVFKQMKHQVLNFCGFKPVQQYYFGPVRTSTPEKRAHWLNKAEKLGSRLVK